jgi:hypothetical protein
MRALATRQRLVKVAALAASTALVAACASKPPTTDASASPTPTTGSTPANVRFAVGTLLVSDGTTSVNVGGTSVTFPTRVTDAAWSHDGSRIAFVDGDGNVATARPDGSALSTLTKPKAGVTRSEPTWFHGSVIFTERSANGRTRLRMVSSNAPTDEQDSYLSAYDEQGKPLVSSSADVIADGPGMEAVFQVQGRGGPEVWVEDLNARAPEPVKVADGAQPALSPDGGKIAFVDRGGQISVAGSSGAIPAVRISAGVKSPTRITWTPDGAEVVFSTPTGIQSIPANAKGAPPRPVSAPTGVPTYLAAARDTVTRLSAGDPVALAVAASRAAWPTQEQYGPGEGNYQAYAAVLVGTGSMPAAIAGGIGAQGPVLFTGKGSLDPRTRDELKRVFGRAQPDYGPIITIAGDTSVISAGVEQAVRKLGYKTERIAGKDQYAISTGLAARVTPGSVQNVYVVDGADLSTLAMAGAAAPMFSDSVVLLARNAALPPAARTYLNRVAAGATVYAVGASAKAAVGASGWRGTVVAVNTRDAMYDLLGARANTVIVVQKSSVEDLAIAASLRGKHIGAQLVAVDGSTVEDGARAWLDASSAGVDKVFVINGKSTVAPPTEETVGRLLSGPLGYSVRENPTAR